MGLGSFLGDELAKLKKLLMQVETFEEREKEEQQSLDKMEQMDVLPEWERAYEVSVKNSDIRIH